MGAKLMILKKAILSIVSTSLLAVSLLELPRAAVAEIPTVTYTSGKYQLKSPDWSKISWSSLNPVQEPGYINITPDIASKLGYNLSRSWSAGQNIDSVIMLGDVDEAFAQSQFTLQIIASRSVNQNNQLTLEDFGLMKWQTIGSLVKAIPSLRNINVRRMKPIQDLLQKAGIYTGGTLSQALNYNSKVSKLSLGQLDLSKYALTSIPKLTETRISKFQNWQQSFINQVPLLNQVPFDKMPQPINSGLDVVGIASVVLGKSERGDSRARENYFVSGKVTRSDKTVVVACGVGQECPYLELGDVAGQQGNLYGKRWASGSSQQVDGGFGILQRVNGGKEPTGRLVYGSGFKVVLTGVNESTGTANFGLFFRICMNFFLGGKSCTPYFIGPVPWVPVQENDLVILGRG
ncbi:hypothetical protein H6G49_25780 [Nostoc sp. PCC 7120 = FACHB-418]|nr:hypothetical protein [Anabaena cylindrica FACHB-318]MBD2266227.1 hypothetical protein [Anabaena sp. FACHB-709]MBD2275958.1 hypothetical protein [Nostoc sp. PCC 7120 = FACHB-418]MBD2287155.1 hypothetical protein [Anabaena cylindrica FACHB-170]MBD2352497.1 hypothetical protein [Trichormus variabilis FACHB-171]HBW32497.1 hypothetical protein [Nostoc sp. UBA8866]